jgi:hypothetical protein
MLGPISSKIAARAGIVLEPGRGECIARGMKESLQSQKTALQPGEPTRGGGGAAGTRASAYGLHSSSHWKSLGNEVK